MLTMTQIVLTFKLNVTLNTLKYLDKTSDFLLNIDLPPRDLTIVKGRWV